MNLIYSTGIFSLIVQVLTAIVDFYVLTLAIPASFTLLRELVIMELIVQMVEFSFYVWMIRKISVIKNITPFRYYDWMITTPTMLITFMFYLMFVFCMLVFFVCFSIWFYFYSLFNVCLMFFYFSIFIFFVF